ncbi:hypothetical protein EV359DRAFT_67515 [Lentinula novae-zelandiae]|nr:hypothetical protein EV359DRAFT_67515 [Lentinula novae-zelandiae]
MDLKLIRCPRIKAFHQIYCYHPGPLKCMSGDEAGMDRKYYKTQVEWCLQELANFLALLSAWYMVATWIMASTIHLESFRIHGILRIGLTWSCKRTLCLYNYQSIATSHVDLRWVAVNSIELVFCDFMLTAVLYRQNTWLVQFQTTYGNFYHVTCSWPHELLYTPHINVIFYPTGKKGYLATSSKRDCPKNDPARTSFADDKRFILSHCMIKFFLLLVHYQGLSDGYEDRKDVATHQI